MAESKERGNRERESRREMEAEERGRGKRERGYRKVSETVPETERRSKSVPKTEG